MFKSSLKQQSGWKKKESHANQLTPSSARIVFNLASLWTLHSRQTIKRFISAHSQSTVKGRFVENKQAIMAKCAASFVYDPHMPLCNTTPLMPTVPVDPPFDRSFGHRPWSRWEERIRERRSWMSDGCFGPFRFSASGHSWASLSHTKVKQRSGDPLHTDCIETLKTASLVKVNQLEISLLLWNLSFSSFIICSFTFIWGPPLICCLSSFSRNTVPGYPNLLSAELLSLVITWPLYAALVWSYAHASGCRPWGSAPHSSVWRIPPYGDMYVCGWLETGQSVWQTQPRFPSPH